MQRRLIYTVEEIPVMPAIEPIRLEPIPAAELRSLLDMLEANQEWLRHVTPALSNEELRAGIGVDLPDEVMEHFAQRFTYNAVASGPPPPRRATEEDIRGRTTCHRFRKAERTPFQQKTCAICLDEFRSNQKIVRLRGCQHDFHKNCVTQWLRRERATCPICKKDL